MILGSLKLNLTTPKILGHLELLPILYRYHLPN